ncbi:MAG: hypothetical protein MUC48_12490 [Leptolyngbya sp. Prado105]|nr:hypothetical protein [Leptolyngbya sp. Prado105]
MSLATTLNEYIADSEYSISLAEFVIFLYIDIHRICTLVVSHETGTLQKPIDSRSLMNIAKTLNFSNVRSGKLIF